MRAQGLAAYPCLSWQAAAHPSCQLSSAAPGGNGDGPGKTGEFGCGIPDIFLKAQRYEDLCSLIVGVWFFKLVDAKMECLTVS
jgi:hypothetical protein